MIFLKRCTCSLLLGLLMALSFAGCTVSENKVASSGYQTISAEDAKTLLENESVVLVDVRTSGEYDEGHIPQAKLMPLDTLKETADKQLTDKSQTIIVYCRSGNRSRQAAQLLSEMGYKDVRDLGGINSWPYETTKAVDKAA